VRSPSLDQVIACNEAVRGPDELSPSADDPDFADLLIAAARGEDVRTEIQRLFHDRAAASGGRDLEPSNPLDALTAEAQELAFYDQ
jgi:hypothetical protein